MAENDAFPTVKDLERWWAAAIDDAASSDPIALLPVRLETKMEVDDDQADNPGLYRWSQLKVRIYPTNIHLNHLSSSESNAKFEPNLSEAEDSAGNAYWAAIRSQSMSAARMIWRDMLRTYGASRAGLIVDETEYLPASNNVDSSLDAQATLSESGFRLLPKRWRVGLYQRVDFRGAKELKHVATATAANEVHDEVRDTSPLPLNGDLPLWMTDYDTAVQKGMAVTINSLTSLAITDISQTVLIAYGVNTSVTNEELREHFIGQAYRCLLYTSPSPRDLSTSRMPSSA